MHVYLLPVVFCVTSILPYFLCVMVWCSCTNHTAVKLKGGAIKKIGGLAMHVASIHLQSMEVSDKQRILYIHGALGAGKK